MNTKEMLISIKSHLGKRFKYTEYATIEKHFDQNGFVKEHEENLLKMYSEMIL